jgi:hypothetical protein
MGGSTGIMRLFRISPMTVSLLFLLFFSFSCEENPVDQYGDTLIRKYEDTKKFERRMSTKNLQDSIRAFHASYERYPGDLRELEEFTALGIH